jgi:signal transduction histidine kinase
MRMMSPVPRGSARAVGLALLFVASALALTLILQQIAARVYFILFVPAVMFSTWFGGRAAGMLASALTVVATIALLPSTELADQLAWLIVAGIVTFGTSALTDKRRTAETLLTAQALEEQSRRRHAETVSQLKTDVLVQVAHELRQPLSAIAVAVRLLEATPDRAGRERATGVLTRQTDHLRRLIDDLFDLSRITKREIHLEKTTIDLCQVVDDTLDVIAADVDARGVAVSSSIPPCPVHMTADPTRVRQILSNLMSNAVKFTPEGGKIHLTVEKTPSHVILRVRDTGRGIHPDRLSGIFEMFQKGDGEGAGLGIGLAVAKGLAEMHGGTVQAHSAGLGRGSEFVVTLPVTGTRSDLLSA